MQKYTYINTASIVPTILLYNAIEQGDGAVIASEILSFDNSGYTDLTIRINSIGGYVFEAFAIISAMNSCKNLTITTVNDGLAASAAGLVLINGDIVNTKAYGIFMMHNVSGGSDNVRQMLEENLVNIFQKRTGISDTKIIQKMLNAETWLNSNQLLQLGFCDTILPLEPRQKITKELQNILNKMENIAQTEVLEALENPIENVDTEIEELVIPEETPVLNTVEAEAPAIDSKDVLIDALRAEIAILKSEVIENRIDTEIKAGLELKKLTTNEVDTWKNLFKLDFDTTKKALDNVKTVVKTPQLNIVKENALEGSMDYKNLAKTDPKKLADIQKNNYPLFREIYKKSFGNYPEDAKAA